MRRKILFVCSANTCRSAVAEAILFEYGRDRYDASSAGLYARPDTYMMQSCAEALERMFGFSPQIPPVQAQDVRVAARPGKEMIRRKMQA